MNNKLDLSPTNKCMYELEKKHNELKEKIASNNNSNNNIVENKNILNDMKNMRSKIINLLHSIDDIIFQQQNIINKICKHLYEVDYDSCIDPCGPTPKKCKYCDLRK
jgi:hypothetical protein